MTAYVSYSLNRAEEYLASLLSQKLRERGFTFITGNNMTQTIDITNRNQIFQANLFVGLISGQSQQAQRVSDEYYIAINHGVPSILLVEDTVQINPQFNGNVIRYNRQNPNTAIQAINQQIAAATPNSNEGIGWILGGAALLAIALLIDKRGK
jgi:hypothetical protein